jgi:hypothetical protein
MKIKSVYCTIKFFYDKLWNIENRIECELNESNLLKARRKSSTVVVKMMNEMK